MSRVGIPAREDQRREWCLWVLVAADINGTTPREAVAGIRNSFVDAYVPAGANEKTEHFALDRIEDHLPEPADWAKLSDSVKETITRVELNMAEIDEAIRGASPRWRVDRMPAIDRGLLRIGVAELLYRDAPRPRATINGLIELAKRYGESGSPAFINGILDQVRKDREIPFK